MNKVRIYVIIFFNDPPASKIRVQGACSLPGVRGEEPRAGSGGSPREGRQSGRRGGSPEEMEESTKWE